MSREPSFCHIYDYHKIAKGRKLYLSKAQFEKVGLDYKAGYYEFDAEGKLILG